MSLGLLLVVELLFARDNGCQLFGVFSGRFDAGLTLSLHFLVIKPFPPMVILDYAVDLSAIMRKHNLSIFTTFVFSYRFSEGSFDVALALSSQILMFGQCIILSTILLSTCHLQHLRFVPHFLLWPLYLTNIVL
jgi:hypothetical protein